ncbi:MAG: transcription termination factor Rho [Rhodothermaceae bacterium]|nr:transcription termination factor Rho [Rhodothermaceae bacterium]MXW33878.1 transcription termination factor Rho [Rhodothermaceae bacterium]MYC03413.1 transcription termination factor Rho [Rhodothermaceae bacterium]MYE62206.1 transcription termination factor Rho [Rhodothermaceae bacterium]MYI18322.1 transcription termination factor Rho [Rhodothermaceae bacterium]
MPEQPFKGMLEIIGDRKFGFIRELRSGMPKNDGDPFCPPSLISRYRLRDGVVLEGFLRPGKKGDLQVSRLTKVMNIAPEAWSRLHEFEEGRIIYPDTKLDLVKTPNDITMRVVDLACPIGKGQRALIVAPPRTGKTLILKEIAASLTQNHPDIHLVALLVDERPEEVTDFRRSTKATVFASSSDQEEFNHVRVSVLAFEYAKRLVELGDDVVLLLDSLTRLGRTFNLWGEGTGRTMSGGLDSGAMRIPRRLFGSARNIEDGGSLTLIATALIETGSRMDEVIFEEFKGTGNAEIVLDREMAHRRVWPAINLRKSRTRNEDLLLGSSAEKHNRLFQVLNSRRPMEAMQALTRHMRAFPTNDALLDALVRDY